MDATNNGVAVNGQVSGAPQANDEDLLFDQLTLGYQPSLPFGAFYTPEGLPQFYLRQDIEQMLVHPDVRQALSYFKGGVAGAEFWGGPNPDDADDDAGLPISDDPEVARFVKEQCERFWDRGLAGIQSGYDYGWVGAENVYEDEGGCVLWKELHHFSPRDTFILTYEQQPVGVRVKNVKNKGFVDLPMASDCVPAKGMWYAHCPRYDSLYGTSQMTAAWRPWRRLAFKDGFESVMDMAIYRFGVGPVIVRYPPKDPQVESPGPPGTTFDSQGRPRRFARDIARQMGEQLKSGASIAMSSRRDSSGEYEWDATVPESTLTGVENLIEIARYFRDQISSGIGVPPELLEAAETGSGYSGRRIPLESFLANQQQIADAILRMFVNQVLRPLVCLNYGGVPFRVQVKSLIKTRAKDQETENQTPGGAPGGGQPGTAQVAAGQPGQHPGELYPPQPVHRSAAMSLAARAVSDRVREIAAKIAGKK